MLRIFQISSLKHSNRECVGTESIIRMNIIRFLVYYFEGFQMTVVGTQQDIVQKKEFEAEMRAIQF